MSVALAPAPILQFLNNAGQMNVGGSLLTQVGGVNYPTFQDSAGTIALPNPIPLNSRGEISNTSGVSCELFLFAGVTYTFTLFDAHGNSIWTAANITAQGVSAVGSMTDEKGSGGQPGFAAGVDFTAGTTTFLTLTGFYGSTSNLWVAFDGVEQGADTYTLSGNVLTFNAPIPVGTQKVYVKGGTALTIGTPGAGTVVDTSVASGTKLFNRIFDWVDVNDFPGVDKTGVKDSTAGMQLAHNTGKLVYYPAGTYTFSSTLTIASGGIRGDGTGLSVLNSTDVSTTDLISFTGSDSGPGPHTPMFHDFTLQGTLTKTAGSGITVNPSVSGNQSVLADFCNVTIIDVPTGFNFVAACYWKLRGCNVINYYHYGVNIQNTAVTDSGDQCISDCFFNTALTNPSNSDCYGINYQSGGGLKLTNTKILGGNYGLVVSFGASASTSDLFISNCSFESGGNGTIAGYAIFIGRVAGSSGFGNIVIVGNEFGFPNGVNIGLNGVTNFVAGLVISSNIIVSGLAAGMAYCLVLQGVIDFNIGPNVLQGVSAGCIGVLADANCTNGNIAPQTYVGISNGGNRMQNSSTTTYVHGAPQNGTTSGIVCSTGYGALFEGTLAVNFPIAYGEAPNFVDVAPSTSSGGAVAAYATAITATGFTIVAISATNGGTVPTIWHTEGIV